MKKAIYVKEFGGYSQLTIKEEDSLGVIGENEVRIDVKAIGVNYADCLVRLGLYKSAKDHAEYKGIPGFEFAGVVKEVGSNVVGRNIGDRVFGGTLFGAYQTEIVVDQRYLVTIPDWMDFSTAASLPTTFVTAFYILNSLAHIKKGESILIRSIGGGVGSWLAILAMRADAKVYGTVSTVEKKAIIEDKGVENVEISGKENFKGMTFDVIANAYGGKSIKEDMARLKKEGRLILYGFHGMIQTTEKGKLSVFSWLRIIYEVVMIPRIHPFILVNKNKSILGCNLSYLSKDTDRFSNAMNELLAVLEDKHTQPPPVTEIPFEEVSRAHYLLERGKTVGKLVLTI